MSSDDTPGEGSSIQPHAARLQFYVPTATAWMTYNFAKDWYEDAAVEATRPLAAPMGDLLREHRNAVRREIMFAVCAAESYLVEWVRDEGLKRDYGALNKYFPPGARRGVTEKWSDVPKALAKDGRLATVPHFNGRHATEWKDLIDYRNGLIHARTARPDTSRLPPDEKPVPDFYALNALDRGWACHVVAEHIEALHRASGTAAPAWLVRPARRPRPSP
jgi:hypothetical protein